MGGFFRFQSRSQRPFPGPDLGKPSGAATTGVISAVAECGAILLTAAVLVLFLGLNVSAIGLVEFTAGSAYLVVELFGLVVVIDVVYVAAFAGLQRTSLAPP